MIVISELYHKIYPHCHPQEAYHVKFAHKHKYSTHGSKDDQYISPNKVYLSLHILVHYPVWECYGK